MVDQQKEGEALSFPFKLRIDLSVGTCVHRELSDSCDTYDMKIYLKSCDKVIHYKTTNYEKSHHFCSVCGNLIIYERDE